MTNRVIEFSSCIAKFEKIQNYLEIMQDRNPNQILGLNEESREKLMEIIRLRL